MKRTLKACWCNMDWYRNEETFRQLIRSLGLQDDHIVLLNGDSDFLHVFSDGALGLLAILKDEIPDVTVVVMNHHPVLRDPYYLHVPLAYRAQRRALLAKQDVGLYTRPYLSPLVLALEQQPLTHMVVHPLYHIALQGKYARLLAQKTDWDEPFGQASLFHSLYAFEAYWFGFDVVLGDCHEFDYHLSLDGSGCTAVDGAPKDGVWQNYLRTENTLSYDEVLTPKKLGLQENTLLHGNYKQLIDQCVHAIKEDE